MPIGVSLARRKGLVLFLLGGAVFALAAFAATVSSAVAASSAGADVCVLLPDTTTSVRYELFDRPYLAKAFKKAGVSATIVNAQGDPQQQRSQADDCMAGGAKVVLLDPLDTGSGTGITKAVVAQGGKVIDYDRLVPGSDASYYVSFDNVRVGKLQAQGLIRALKAKGVYSHKPVIAQLNGSVKDNNGHLFKQGADSVLNPLVRKGVLKRAKAGDQWTDWQPTIALRIFESMLLRNDNKIDGVLAANDGIAGAVASALKNNHLKPIPLTGQDATPTGVQLIISGWQSGTVYKSIRLQAAAAAQVAIDILKNKPVKTNGKVSGTPSVLLKPVWVTKKNYKLLFKDGFVKQSQVCVGAYKKYCK